MRLVVKILLGLVIIILILVVALNLRARRQRTSEESFLATLRKNITVSSGSFPAGGDMPTNCTCKGKEVSPALTWESSARDVESYVVLTTDYDVPTPILPIFNLSHWVVYNLPASVRSLPEGLTAEQVRMLGGKIGKNGTGDLRYIGPCPPIGRHAYVFRVYALDESLSFSEAPGKQEVLDAMKGHILGYGELTGYFQ